MEKIRALIVDDEPLAREGIRMRLDQEPDIEVIGECTNGREAVLVIERDSPDLVFLDVQMPRMDGFGVITALGPRRMPHVIFVTAYDEHALRAFEVHALDYLLKPVDGARFLEALARARSRIRGPELQTIGEQLRALITDLKPAKKYLARLSIKAGKAGKADGRILFLSVDDIDWIEAADNYVLVHAGRDSHLLHTTMNSLEDRLDPDAFLRIHRSTIVNLRRIKEMHPMFHGEYRIILKDGAELTSGRSYRDKLQRLLDNSL
ncbi:MAG: LytTR family DNA-binding domain-containing protein [Acidobacteria bacterium]|nr:LytTR family DNA-binding domain-containing protein [Acidobacteriota bacterium]